VAAPAAASPTVVQQGPGFLSNVASTAGGVALGHMISHAVMGGGNHDNQPQQVQQQPQQQYAGAQVCSLENEAFMKCTNDHPYDISVCTNYLDMLKQCRTSYGL